MPNGNLTLDGNLYVRGTANFNTLRVPDATVTDAMVASDAAIDASKLQRRFTKEYSQTGTATTLSAPWPLYVAYKPGTIVEVAASSIAAAVGAATVVIDVKKNGTTVLSSTITLDSGNTAYTKETGTISSASYTSGDHITVTLTATAGGGTLPTGTIVAVTFEEDPA